MFINGRRQRCVAIGGVGVMREVMLTSMQVGFGFGGIALIERRFVDDQ